MLVMDVRHRPHHSLEALPSFSSAADQVLGKSPTKPRVVRSELDMIGADLAQAARERGTLPLEHESLRRLWNDDLPDTPGQYGTGLDSGLSSTKVTPARNAVGPLILATPEEAIRSSYFTSSSSLLSPNVGHMRGGSTNGSTGPRYNLSTNPSSPTSMRHSIQGCNPALLHPHLQQQQFVTRDRSRSMPPLFLSHASDPSSLLFPDPITPPLRAAISDPFTGAPAAAGSKLRPMADDFTPATAFARLTPPPAEFFPDYGHASTVSIDQARQDFFASRGLNNFPQLPLNARFFVIKSFDREDVLKAM